MDDDQNRTLDFNEFKKGIRDYGLYLEPKVICCGLVYIHCIVLKVVVTDKFTFTYTSNCLFVGITRDVLSF